MANKIAKAYTKKETNAELQRRIQRAIVHVDRDKSYQGVTFVDKGLRLEVMDDYCVISTNSHKHLFDAISAQGFSRPYLYIKRFIDIALENDCKVEGGYSYAKLFEVLKAKEDKLEYNIATLVDWYFMNLFSPLYSIGEKAVEQFNVYFDYMHNIAKQSILLDEQKEDLTEKAFVEKYIGLIKEFTANMGGTVLLPKLTDEERVKQNIDAMAKFEEEQMNGGVE